MKQGNEGKKKTEERKRNKTRGEERIKTGRKRAEAYMRRRESRDWSAQSRVYPAAQEANSLMKAKMKSPRESRREYRHVQGSPGPRAASAGSSWLHNIFGCGKKTTCAQN